MPLMLKKMWKNKSKFNCLRDVFRPMYLLLSLLGLFPYRIGVENNGYRFPIIKKSIYLNATCALFYVSVLGFFVTLHIYHLYFALEASAMTAALMLQANYITELFNLTLFCIITYISFYANRFKFVKIMNVIASFIDNRDEILAGIHFQIRVVALGWIGLTCVLQACVNFTRTESTWKMFLVLFTFNLPQLLQFTTLGFFYVLIMMIVGVLNDINEKAAAYSREKVYCGLKNVQPYRKQLTLSQMETMYTEIIDVKEMVNHVFEAPILVALMQCFHSMVSEAFVIYHGLATRNDTIVHVIVNCIVWIVYQIMKVYAVARAGSVLKQEISKLANVIQSIPIERQDMRFLMEIQHFTSTISFYGNDLTAFGLFPLDATLSFKIFAAAAMYIIILVQFDKTK